MWGKHGFNIHCIFGQMQSKENPNTDYAASLEQEVKITQDLKAFVMDSSPQLYCLVGGHFSRIQRSS